MKAKFFQLLEEINNADPRFTVYAKALLFYYMPNQGETFITHNKYIAECILGIHENTLLKAKKELVNRGVIFSDDAYSGETNNRKSGTYVTVNYDWKAANNPHLNKVIQNKVIQNKPIQNKPIENNLIQEGALIKKSSNKIKDVTKENVHQGKDLKKEKGEGAAAEPPHGPAFSETAPKKTGSTGKAQEQPRPFMAADYSEEDPAQEKPKKKPKGKGKAAGEIEIPEVEEIKSYIAGYIQENHKKGVHSYIWTDWELTETAKDIQAAIPKYKWKDWQHGARNWIRNSKPVAFKPKMTDPARDTRNQPQRRKSYEHLKEHKGAALEAESRTITQN